MRKRRMRRELWKGRDRLWQTTISRVHMWTKRGKGRGGIERGGTRSRTWAGGVKRETHSCDPMPQISWNKREGGGCSQRYHTRHFALRYSSAEIFISFYCSLSFLEQKYLYDANENYVISKIYSDHLQNLIFRIRFIRAVEIEQSCQESSQCRKTCQLEKPINQIIFTGAFVQFEFPHQSLVLLSTVIIEGSDFQSFDPTQWRGTL